MAAGVLGSGSEACSPSVPRARPPFLLCTRCAAAADSTCSSEARSLLFPAVCPFRRVALMFQLIESFGCTDSCCLACSVHVHAPTVGFFPGSLLAVGRVESRRPTGSCMFQQAAFGVLKAAARLLAGSSSRALHGTVEFLGYSLVSSPLECVWPCGPWAPPSLCS